MGGRVKADHKERTVPGGRSVDFFYDLIGDLIWTSIGTQNLEFWKNLLADRILKVGQDQGVASADRFGKKNPEILDVPDFDRFESVVDVPEVISRPVADGDRIVTGALEDAGKEHVISGDLIGFLPRGEHVSQSVGVWVLAG